jgi:hypothetical protein
MSEDTPLPWGGTLLNGKLDIGMSPQGMSPVATYPGVHPGAKERSGGFLGAACEARCNSGERNRQRTGGGRERLSTRAPGLQSAVPEEAVHRSAFAKAAADRPP